MVRAVAGLITSLSAISSFGKPAAGECDNFTLALGEFGQQLRPGATGAGRGAESSDDPPRDGQREQRPAGCDNASLQLLGTNGAHDKSNARDVHFSMYPFVLGLKTNQTATHEESRHVVESGSHRR